MDHNQIIKSLASNVTIFSDFLNNKSKEEYLWRPAPEKWCLLEIVCHLYDEEREDFRTRVRFTLENPDHQPPSINPLGWVTERKYIEQDYDFMVGKFLKERKISIDWLKSLKDPQWNNFYEHPVLGALSAEHFLVNWLAHDIFHFRQFIRLQYEYVKFTSGNDLTYAGAW